MERQDRATKKTLRALMVVGGILLLALIGAIVYFFVIEPGTIKPTEEENTKTCGCYMIDPAVISDCGDPKRAFLFNLNTVSSDETCNAQCDINEIADNLLNSSTPRESYKTCSIRSILDTRCETMILKDQDGKIITGKIKPTDEINVEATFEESTYTQYMFKINSEDSTPDKVDGNKITKKISDFEGVTSVEIFATAKDKQEEQINSPVCRRIVDIESSGQSSVTSITAITEQQADGKTKISQITVSVGQISSNNIKIRFSFSGGFSALTAIDGITVEKEKGTLTMSKLDLYDTANFASDSFNILNEHLGPLDISGEVFVDDASIGSATTTVQFTNTTDDEDDDVVTDENKSNFTVRKTVAETCIEKTEGSNKATYTITVTNVKNIQDSITSIKDKLPLGFSYVLNSSVINNTTTPDTGVVFVTPVGDSQEIVWQPASPWSVPANGTLIIKFEATAGTTAINGQNLNEVIVTPVEVPLDPATLRTEVYLLLAQDCDNPTEEEQEIPETGIFDTFIGRILTGIFILLLGWFIYTKPQGNFISERLINTGAYKTYELTKYKVFNPKKYFEEKIIRKNSKENR